MDQYVGKMLDNRYELLELIGSGGMANVYKTKCHRLNRLVAVKILKSDLAQNADFRRRFRDESLAVAQLSHANIMSVYDVSSTHGIEYIVMELLDGITLKQYMERRNHMNWREALHFITQIMRGLSHAHSRGIIHRDIKPQNIMVLRDGTVKVADFGIACLAGAGQTLTQEALGSVHYISPEQAKGDRIDERSDVYSAGVVLYEMLTGRLPFEGDSAVSVAIQHLSSVPLDPREINPEIPEALELICKKAMCSDLKHRYASADAMLADLEAFRKDPKVDLDYIKTELAEKVDTEPTDRIPVKKVNAAAKKAEKLQEKEEDSFFKGGSKKLTGLLIAAAVLIIAIFGFIISSFSSGDNNGTYAVPNLLGYTLEEANALEDVADIFTIEVMGQKSVEGFAAGQIVEQTPTAGAERKSNLVIQVYVCPEQKTVEMPNLLGNVYQSAKIVLQNYDIKLRISQSEGFSDEYAPGQIMETIPAAGTPLKKGDGVMLVVSKGPEKITVPTFTGMMYEGAKAQAESIGLVVGTPTYEYSIAPVGQVIEQSIAETTTVQGGTTITFTVSGSASEQNRIMTVEFLMPDELYEETSVRVEFVQDGQVVDVSFYSGTVASFTYNFEGAVGSASTVYAKCNGITLDSKVISF